MRISEGVRNRLQELHPVPELQEQGYPGVWQRQTAGIAPRDVWHREFLVLPLPGRAQWLKGCRNVNRRLPQRSRGTWHMSWEALQLEWNNNEDDGPSGLEVSLKLIQPVPCVKIASIKRKMTGWYHRRSFLKGTESPICRPGRLLQEACTLPGAWIKGEKWKCPPAVQPSGYYPFFG